MELILLETNRQLNQWKLAIHSRRQIAQCFVGQSCVLWPQASAPWLYLNWHGQNSYDFPLCMMNSTCCLLWITGKKFTLGFVFDLWMKWALVQVASHQASSPKSSRKSFRSSLKSLPASRKQLASPKNSDSSCDCSPSLWLESASLTIWSHVRPSVWMSTKSCSNFDIIWCDLDPIQV